MAIIGYWASQEQHSLQNLLNYVIEAEKGGFTKTMTSDHFHPWWHDNGYGNFTWVWMAAAAERTKKMQFITGVTALVYRYNPGIIAQAFASLDVLYPGRIGLGVGTGEAMNEVPLGFDWPSAKIRLERTKEALEIINRLWKRDIKRRANYRENNNSHDNDFVNFNGEYYKIKDAKLYTPSSTDIPLYMAAFGPEAIKTAAKYTDGLITITKPDNADEILDSFNTAALEEGKDPAEMEKIVSVKVSYSEDYDNAFRANEPWRTTLIEDVFNSDISNPRILQQKAKKEVPDEKLKKSTLIVTSIEDLIKPLEEYVDSQFTQVYIHSTSPDELDFIRKFSSKVLPHLNDKGRK